MVGGEAIRSQTTPFDSLTSGLAPGLPIKITQGIGTQRREFMESQSVTVTRPQALVDFIELLARHAPGLVLSPSTS